MLNLERVLNNQNSWIYVIDGDTYELRYINEKDAPACAGIQTGICCYDVLSPLEKPCAAVQSGMRGKGQQRDGDL